MTVTSIFPVRSNTPYSTPGVNPGKLYGALMGRPRIITIGDSIHANAAQSQFAATLTYLGMTSNGYEINVAQTAHGIQANTRIHVVRYDQNEFNGVFRVNRIIDANNFTYVISTRPTVATATATSFPTSSKVVTLDKKANRDITGLACMLLRGRAVECINVAVGGERTDETIYRMNTEILPQGADFALIHIGFNDVQQYIGNSTLPVTVGSMRTTPITYQSIIDNITTICNTLSQAGTIPLLATLVPFDSGGGSYSTTRAVLHHNINQWMRDFCYGRTDVILVDYFSVLTDPTSATGNYATDMAQTDKVHPSDSGAMACARAVAEALDSVLPLQPLGATSQDYNYNTNSGDRELFDNVLMVGATSGTQISGTGSSGVLPPQFSGAVSGGGSQTGVYSVVPNETGLGNKVRMVLTGGGGTDDGMNVQNVSSIHSRVSAGDTIVAEAEISLSGASASLRGLNIDIIATVDGVSNVLVTSQFSTDSADGFKDDFKGIVRTPQYTVPSGVSITVMRARVRLSSRAVGEPIIAEVSALHCYRLQTGVENVV